MKLPKLKWPIAFLTFAVCLLMLLGGYWLWQKNAISQPLLAQLQQVPGVRTAEVSKVDGRLQISLTADQTIDFLLAAPQVEQLVEQAAGTKAEIIWEQHSDSGLSEVRRSLDFILRESQVRHEYVVMNERVQSALDSTDIRYQLGVDERHIYLKLQQGTSLWLEVLPLLGMGGVSE